MIKSEKRLLFVTLNRIVFALHYLYSALFVCLSHWFALSTMCLMPLYPFLYYYYYFVLFLFSSTCPYLYMCNSCIFVYEYVYIYICMYVCMYIYLICTYLYFCVLLLVFSVICMHQGVTQFQFSVCMYGTCGRIDNKADLDFD